MAVELQSGYMSEPGQVSQFQVPEFLSRSSGFQSLEVRLKNLQFFKSAFLSPHPPMILCLFCKWHLGTTKDKHGNQ